MKSIKEKAEEYTSDITNPVTNNAAFLAYKKGANYVLDEIEKELTRRMLEDYNQGAEEDEVAQGCMATMIMFVKAFREK